MEQVSPGAGKTGKTLTSPEWVADLEATVNGGNGVERNYSTSSQGRHVNVILRSRLRLTKRMTHNVFCLYSLHE